MANIIKMKELQMLLKEVLAERLKANQEADKQHKNNEYLYAHWNGKVDAFNLVIQEAELLLVPQPGDDIPPQLNEQGFAVVTVFNNFQFKIYSYAQ